ncbi:biosynthetic-type acetolactate synthase large subunit [Secundilactobacillus collinoides]|uniref:Acetolactate synthase n=1 Tax=Secundilactobacillus collinoides DSM 20515 = JCM 1123 TaxID=1423733 RepID=A0A0R2B8Q5_SECCO|nr:biosynthetic-type acetolactate synthase large subunit [Secundilactobacillus collinoides]KRM75871.1 acetolactate synthase, large subunit [Secundilactobacillus collinoides DSM 20515 = JCM 1123]
MDAEITPPATTTTETGARILVDTLRQQGVTQLFGYPGGTILSLFDAMYDRAFNITIVRHEQGATHAAEGYAKATGKTGVVSVTSGPGASNAVTGIADAMMDSVPMVVFTGQVGRKVLGTEAFQELNTMDVTKPIVKANFQIMDVNDLQTTINDAFELAQSGRKGPVVIDLPKDVLDETAEFQPTPEPHAAPDQSFDTATLEDGMQALSKAKRPIAIVGAGTAASGGAEKFNEFIHNWQLPVVSTLLGLGTVTDSDPLFLGMGGMHGTYAANMALAETDFIVNVGSRFDDRLVPKPAGYADDKTILHIDIDTKELNKTFATQFAVQADAKAALTAMTASSAAKPDTTDWRARTEEWATTHPNRAESAQNAPGFDPQAVIAAAGKATNGDATVVTDVGQHQMWVAQAYPFTRTKQIITSGGLGTMGYGLPAAIGAKFANPDKDVILFVGDGGFQMTSEELEVIANEDLNIKIFLLNNHALGMIRQWQDQFYSQHRYKSLFDRQPNFDKLMAAYDLQYQKLSPDEDLDEQMTKIFADTHATLIEVTVPVDEQAYPMVAPGHTNDDMFGM